MVISSLLKLQYWVSELSKVQPKYINTGFKYSFNCSNIINFHRIKLQAFTYLCIIEHDISLYVQLI